MSRSLHKSWQNKRPGWTRRVRWYEMPLSDGGVSIRLNFIDEKGMANRFFDTREEAQTAYDGFVGGASARSAV